jgi:lipopolysaccharide export LptBFGC system permease protein LptF
MESKKFKIQINLKTQFYILSNILSYYIFIFFSLISLTVLLQFFRITDLIIINRGDPYKIYLIMSCLITLTLPILLPTTLLLALFFAYKNLREENELIAFSSLGISNFQLLFPSIFVCLMVTFFCYICNTKLGPNSHIKSSLIENGIRSSFLQNSLAPKVFYDQGSLVIYSEEKIKGEYHNVFIKDKKRKSETLAKTAKFIANEKLGLLNLRLTTGRVIAQRTGKIENIFEFSEYDIPIPLTNDKNKISAYYMNQTNQQIKDILATDTVSKKEATEYKIELFKRIAVSLISFVFWAVFITFGFSTHNRTEKSSRFGIGLSLGFGYWILYFMSESIAFRNESKLILFAPVIIYILFLYMISFFQRPIHKRKALYVF